MTTLPFEQQPIYVYKSGLSGDGSFLDLASVVDDYQTLRFKHGWNTPGDFELTINKNSNYASQFTRGRVIQVGSNNYRCGAIYEVRKNIGPDGALSELITVSGYELPQWFDRRIILPPGGQDYYTLSASTPAETVVKSLIRDEIGSGASANRQDANMTLVADAATGSNYVLSARYDNLLSIIAACNLATYSGVFAYLDHTAKKWVVDFGLGTNRTASVIFTTDRDTAQAAQLDTTEKSYKSMAYVGGQGEGSARTIVTRPVSEPTGIDRREMWVDARDLTLTASLQNRGDQKLAENSFTQFLTVDALAYSQLIYGQSYNVGDNVTVTQFGVTQTPYITSAEESWSKGVYSLKLGFDRSPPTITGQLSYGLSQIGKTFNATEIPQGLSPTDSPTFVDVTLTGLTASLPVFTDSSKALVSNTMTGTGSVVMSATPILTGLLSVKNTTAAAAPPSGLSGAIAQFSQADATIARMEMLAWGSGTGADVIYMGRRSAGTIGSPTGTIADTALVRLGGTGRGSTGYVGNTRGSFDIVASETWTDSNTGTYLRFQNTATGTGTNREVWRMSDAGVLSSSLTTGGAALPAAVSATTVLQLASTDSNITRMEIFGWAGAPTILGRRAAGTIGTPAATASGNGLLVLAGTGWSTSGYSTTTRVSMTLSSDEAWTDSAQGTKVAWSVTTAGTTTTAEAWRISNAGTLSNTAATGTAYIHLKAGTATASTAPFKFTAGTNLTAAEAGAAEWDGTNLFLTQTTGPTRKTVAFTDSTLTGIFQGTIITSVYGGTGNGFTKFTGPTTTEKTFTLPNASATILTTNNATYTATPADPAGNATTTAKMQGLAGAFTPANSTRVTFIIAGQVANNTAGDAASIQLRYGTGSAPANAAAVTGTAGGAAQTPNSISAAQKSGVMLVATITGLTPSTAYWFDVSLAAVTGGTVTLTGVTMMAFEE